MSSLKLVRCFVITMQKASKFWNLAFFFMLNIVIKLQFLPTFLGSALKLQLGEQFFHSFARFLYLEKIVAAIARLVSIFQLYGTVQAIYITIYFTYAQLLVCQSTICINHLCNIRRTPQCIPQALVKIDTHTMHNTLKPR